MHSVKTGGGCVSVLDRPHRELALKIAYLVPFPGVEGDFYDWLLAIAGAAAEQLGVELEILDLGRTPEQMSVVGRSVAHRRSRPDCVLLPNYLGAGHLLLPMFEEAGIHSFLVIDGMSPSDYLVHGKPRRQRAHWLGEIQPDDVAAGKELARVLAERAAGLGLVAPDGRVHVGLLCGDQTNAGRNRFKGWLEYQKEHPPVVQVTVQYAGWVEQTAREATTLMLGRHPEIGVIWCANDSMALGAVTAATENGRVPGRDLLVGGMDLLPKALRCVADGSMAVTLGGHVLDGARALILVHDYLRGHDFTPTLRRSLLEPVTAERAPSYLSFFEQQGWRSIDFRRFSLATDPKPAALTLASVLDHGLR